MFHVLIAEISASQDSVYVELPLLGLVLDLVVKHVDCFRHFFFMVPFAKPTSVVLSTWMGVTAWWCPMLISILQRGMTSLSFEYVAPIPTSAADPRTWFWIFLEHIWVHCGGTLPGRWNYLTGGSILPPVYELLERTGMSHCCEYSVPFRFCGSVLLHLDWLPYSWADG